MRRVFFIFFMSFYVFWGGCSSPSSKRAEYSKPSEVYPVVAKSIDSQSLGVQNFAAKPEVAIKKKEQAALQEVGSSKSQKMPAKRMVHYNGYLRMSVVSTTETLERAEKFCEEAKGYVESRSGTSITLRIPVEKFQEVFAQLAGIGDVIERSITAHDVTDSYFSVDMHLKSMKATRERFLILLEKAQNEQEKLKILQEVRRLTEAIDQMEQQLKTLSSLAAYSRLTLVVHPKQDRQGMTTQTEVVSAFHWIYGLSPFRRDIALSGDFMKMTVPQGMVALEAERHWIAESPDGAVFWASRRANKPKGDSNFWIEAIKKRLAPEYHSSETTSAGSFKILQLSEQEPAYRYWIGVCVKENSIEVIEAYFSNVDQENRYKAAILASIERGGL